VAALASWLTSVRRSSARRVFTWTLAPLHQSTEPNMVADWTHAGMTLRQLAGDKRICRANPELVHSFLPFFGPTACPSGWTGSPPDSEPPDRLLVKLDFLCLPPGPLPWEHSFPSKFFLISAESVSPSVSVSETIGRPRGAIRLA